MSNMAKIELTWHFHVRAVENPFDMGDMERFDMELHVNPFMTALDSFDMEVPCQMSMGNHMLI